MFGYLKNLFQLVISPGSAWEDISAEGQSVDLLLRRGLWPMVALASVSVILHKLLFSTDADWSITIVMVLTVAASYVCAYFMGGRILHARALSMTITDSLSTQKCFTVVSYVLGLLCLVQVLTEMIPHSIALSYLLPAGVSIVLWKAEIYLGIRKDMTLTYYIWGVGCLILPPFLIQGLINSII